jgi:hypothetical protein
MKWPLALLCALVLQDGRGAAFPAPSGLDERYGPIAFSGFVFDPIKTMQRDGVFVVIQQGVDEQGNAGIAVRVLERKLDTFGNVYWQERTALCPAPSASSVGVLQPVEPSPASYVLFDRFHPPENEQPDGDHR